MEKLKKLDDGYIGLLPQLYNNVKQQVGCSVVSSLTVICIDSVVVVVTDYVVVHNVWAPSWATLVLPKCTIM